MTITIKKGAILPAVILVICFLAGGVTQFLGVLSLTQSNYLVLGLICLYFSSKLSMPALKPSELILAALAIYVVAGVVLNGSTATNVAVYLYYLICPFLTVRFVRRFTSESPAFNEGRVYSWILYFLILQFIVATIQNIFALELTRISAIEVMPLDIVSGTFFMKSDGSLSAFCIIVALTIIWSSEPLRRKVFVVALSLAIVLLANAKAFQQLLPVILVWALVSSVILKSRYRRVNVLLLSILGMLAVLIGFEEIVYYWREFSDHLFDVYDFRYGDNNADRFAPLGEILNTDLSWFGRGALTYYNPITKQWLYYSGFSLIYNFYIDYGLIGLILALGYFFALTIEIVGNGIKALTLFSVLLVFCMFSPAITDLAFLIFYTTCCLLIASRPGRLVANEEVIPRRHVPLGPAI